MSKKCDNWLAFRDHPYSFQNGYTAGTVCSLLIKCDAKVKTKDAGESSASSAPSLYSTKAALPSLLRASLCRVYNGFCVIKVNFNGYKYVMKTQADPGGGQPGHGPPKAQEGGIMSFAPPPNNSKKFVYFL